ncbi:MAG: zeta toxin family protein [Eggerthellaceae bacterium]|nr:zeta toxin family protein [Eggerthellaceae bacterium]
MAYESNSPEKHALSKYENQRIFETYIIPNYFDKLTSATNPSVHFFGAQPGAGKSAIQASTKQALVELDGASSVASIIGDEFRSYHPDYSTLMQEDDNLAAFYTDHDSGRWVERSITYTLQAKPHVILEGTLRNPQTTLDTANLYKDAGFEQYLHIVAVHEFISRLRIFERYIGQIEKAGFGRYTMPEAHGRAYTALPQSLKTLTESRMFHGITIYNASGNVIAQANGVTEAIPVLDTALMSERSGDNLDYASLIDTAEQLIIRVKQASRLAVLGDLTKLIGEIRQAAERHGH